MAPRFEDLKAEYASLWSRMVIRPDRTDDIDVIARKLVNFKPRYQTVSSSTRVPWFIIAVLHQRESSANFNTHLHNGDPLSAQTRHVPVGRPPAGNPPFTWEESAIDALTMPAHALHQVPSWTIEPTCYEIEKYNGFGYRNNHPSVKSPYLWSFSNIYECGKYVADGVFDPDAIDKQCGTMPLLRRMMELDNSVTFPAEGAGAVAIEPAVLAMQSRGEPVIHLQTALQQRGYPISEIDGIYGTETRDAVMLFQRTARLPETGIADIATVQMLAQASVRPRPLEGSLTGAPIQIDDILKALIGALGKPGIGTAGTLQVSIPPVGGTLAGNPQTADILRKVLGAFLGTQAGQPAPGGAALPADKPSIPLTFIDKMLGGQALAGKKTSLAIVAYAGFAILQAVGVIGSATPAGMIINVAITAFGALGGLSKVDRVIQSLGAIAAKK